jgi:sulfoxide reductase heme-binding subunit YedZ
VKYVRFDKFILLINGLVPAGMMWWDVRHNAFVNPVEYVLHTTGLMALIFLVLTLCVTPLRKLTGWNYASHFRRMLGLYAFFYALAHFGTYFFKQKDSSVSLVFDDVINRPFILLGMLALLSMVPLAATSTNAMIKWMGAARWKQLHQLVYVAAGAAAWHFYQFPKSDRTKPLIVIVILAVLFLYRIVENYRAEWKKKHKARAAIPVAAKATES